MSSSHEKGGRLTEFEEYHCEIFRRDIGPPQDTVGRECSSTTGERGGMIYMPEKGLKLDEDEFFIGSPGIWLEAVQRFFTVSSGRCGDGQ